MLQDLALPAGAREFHISLLSSNLFPAHIHESGNATQQVFMPLVLPGPEVSGVGMSVVQGQEVVFFFYGEWQEDELDSTSFLAHNDPGTVRPVWVAVGKSWRFYAAISALQSSATCVDETWETQETKTVRE